MVETEHLVKQEIAKLQALLRQMRIFDDNGKLEDYCLSYLQKKTANKPLRAYFVRKMYEYLAVYPECDKAFQNYPDAEVLFLQKLPFIFEVVITIQYLHNHILDEKYDVKNNNHPMVVQNLLSSNVLRELLFMYMEQELPPHFPDQKKITILKQAIRNLFLRVDLGQYLDKEYNHYKNWKSEMPQLAPSAPFFDELVHKAIDKTLNEVKAEMPEKAAFVEAYFQRIYLSNVYFFRCMTEVLLDLGDYCGSQHEPILLFSTQYGFMLQIINDYADFAYSEDKREQNLYKTAGKKTTDLFADLFNSNVTLPLIYHLKQGGRRKIEAYLEGGNRKKNLLMKYPKQIMQEITQSGSIQDCVLKSMDLAMSAKGFLDKENQHSGYFSHMLDMAVDNKFYQIFK